MSDVRSGLKFSNYIVDKVEFYNNKNFTGNKVNIKLNINSSVEFINDNKFNVTLNAKIFENAIENNYPFSMNVVLIGFFEVENIDIEKLEMFAEKNAVTILYPYLRSIISTYTANSNIETLILPPINVVKYIEQKYSSNS